MLMKFVLLGLLSLCLLAGCAAPSPAPGLGTAARAKKYSLSCDACDYVEELGSRSIKGSVWNETNKFQDLAVDIEEKDANGNLVEATYNLSLMQGPSVSPNASIPFSQGVNRRAVITQVTFQFRERDRNDVKARADQALSPVYTRQLHVLPVPPGVQVAPAEP